MKKCASSSCRNRVPVGVSYCLDCATKAKGLSRTIARLLGPR